jgi:hypothetical protein
MHRGQEPRPTPYHGDIVVKDWLPPLAGGLPISAWRRGNCGGNALGLICTYKNAICSPVTRSG